MKKFKTALIALTLILILAPVVQSCLDDDDDGYLAIATFRTTENDDPYFTLDNGDKMYPQRGGYSNLDNGQRVYVYFDIIEEKKEANEYQIEVKAIEKILTKDLFVMDEETVDSIGDDKINITGLWFGDGYLNVRFQFAGTRNPSKLHMVNLVYNEIEGANESEAGYISLEFRHNAYEDYESEILNGIVSFKGPFTEEDVKGLKIRYKSIYDGVKHVKIDFKTAEGSDRGFTSNSGSAITATSIAY